MRTALSFRQQHRGSAPATPLVASLPLHTMSKLERLEIAGRAPAAVGGAVNIPEAPFAQASETAIVPADERATAGRKSDRSGRAAARGDGRSSSEETFRDTSIDSSRSAPRTNRMAARARPGRI